MSSPVLNAPVPAVSHQARPTLTLENPGEVSEGPAYFWVCPRFYLNLGFKFPRTRGDRPAELVERNYITEACLRPAARAFSGHQFRLQPVDKLSAALREHRAVLRPRGREGCHSSSFCLLLRWSWGHVHAVTHHPLGEPTGETPGSWAQRRGHWPVLTHALVTAQLRTFPSLSPPGSHVVTQWDSDDVGPRCRAPRSPTPSHCSRPDPSTLTRCMRTFL